MDRSRLLELLLANALANAVKRAAEDRPDNFFILPSDNRVWREMFKKCEEDYMVVGVEFTTDDHKVIRADILQLARKFNRQAIFLRAEISADSIHKELRQALGDVQYVPSFLIVSFLEGRKEIHQYEGVVTIRNAFVSGKLGKDFEECIIRRAKLKVAEDLAERLASDLAAALLMKQKEMEARGSETAVQRKEREQRESAKQLEEEKKRHQEEEEWEKEQAKEVQKARNIAADDVRKKRPEFVAELLSMDLETAPAKEILIVMKKLGLNPAGCLERGDLIAALKEGVPELKEKLLTTQTSSKLLTENLSNLDYDLLQSVADSATKTDLQEAELHDLRVLLSQAQLKVLDYPDRNSMIHALEQVKSVATMRKRSKAMCYGTVFQSDKFSADVEDIDNLKKKVKELQDKLNKYEKKPNYEKSLSTDPPPAN